MNEYIGNNNRHIILFLFTFLLGVFLHQSIVIHGLGNISIADGILVFTIICLSLCKRLNLPRFPVMAFIFFTSYILFVSFYFTPFRFSIEPNLKSFLVNYLKLLVLFLYLILGYNLAREKLLKFLIKIYSYTAFVISIIGFVSTFISLPTINDILFKFGNRLNGFMNDPNYFAILQITAIPYFIESPKRKYSYFILFLLILSIISSGSKTGFVVLAIYLLFKMVEKFIKKTKNYGFKKYLNRYIYLQFFAIFILVLILNLEPVLKYLNLKFPITHRVTELLFDFKSSISSGGSSRDIAWKTAFNIILLSPIFGVGIDHYLNVSMSVFNINVIAHNTYLQIAAEWGLPISLLFLSFLIYVVYIIKNKVFLIVERDILFVFLLGSISISLNNARFFWVILGALIYLYKKK